MRGRWTTEEVPYGHKENPSTQAAEAARQIAEHANVASARKNKMGARSLAVGLQHPQMGVGAGTLEQIITGAQNGTLQKPRW